MTGRKKLGLQAVLVAVMAAAAATWPKPALAATGCNEFCWRCNADAQSACNTTCGGVTIMECRYTTICAKDNVYDIICNGGGET